MATVDRRGGKRIPVKFKVDFIHDEDYLISFSRDLSVDGMFIHTENPPDVGQRVELQFSMYNVEKLEVSAKVVWVNRSSSPKDLGMGVKFIKPKAALKRDILSVVNKVAVLDDSVS